MFDYDPFCAAISFIAKLPGLRLVIAANSYPDEYIAKFVVGEYVVVQLLSDPVAGVCV